MVAEHKIDRQKLISGHNPVLTEIATDSPLTVGNGELAFTADITGMQTLYEEYQELPLCTMSQWGWHTKPVSREKYNYTLDDLVMTEYVNREGRLLKYPQDKKVGNEDVYNWLRENPHRLNLVRVRLQWEGVAFTKSETGFCEWRGAGAALRTGRFTRLCRSAAGTGSV